MVEEKIQEKNPSEDSIWLAINLKINFGKKWHIKHIESSNTCAHIYI